MLRKILESRLGTMTNSEFAEVLDLAETDIRVNRLNHVDPKERKRTSFKGFIEIATSCFITLGRGQIA